MPGGGRGDMPPIHLPPPTLTFRANVNVLRDECRRRLAQGDFDIGGGSGGVGGSAGSIHLSGGGKITESPVADVNSLLTGTHLQVRR